MNLKVGDKVKIIECIDSSNPIEKRYMNQIGEIEKIDDSNAPSVNVIFNDGWLESFWPEELKRI